MIHSCLVCVCVRWLAGINKSCIRKCIRKHKPPTHKVQTVSRYYKTIWGKAAKPHKCGQISTFCVSVNPCQASQHNCNICWPSGSCKKKTSSGSQRHVARSQPPQALASYLEFEISPFRKAATLSVTNKNVEGNDGKKRKASRLTRKVRSCSRWGCQVLAFGPPSPQLNWQPIATADLPHTLTKPRWRWRHSPATSASPDCHTQLLGLPANVPHGHSMWPKHLAAQHRFSQKHWEPRLSASSRLGKKRSGSGSSKRHSNFLLCCDTPSPQTEDFQDFYDSNILQHSLEAEAFPKQVTSCCYGHSIIMAISSHKMPHALKQGLYI